MRKKLALIFTLMALLSGCESNISKETNKIKNKEPIITTQIDKKSKTHFGLLGSATINIYELGSGQKRLVKSFKTSSGSTINDIGNFNPYYELLDSKKFYQYELTGGKNWDIDKDSKVDIKPTNNKRIYKRTNRGSNVQVAWWGSKSSGYKAVISD